MYKIQILNNIALGGLERLPAERFQSGPDVSHPDGIMVRSFNMHDMEIPESLLAVARAGAGVNNIPVDTLTNLGIPVFNAPGANANAVKELVLAGLLMAARNLCQAWHYTRDLDGSDAEVAAAVEAGKKKFVGIELPGRTLGVVGLGAIGVQVANSALDLGMQVVGHDPAITVRRAWQLSSGVEQAVDLDEVFSRADMVTVHVPLIDATRGLVNDARLRLMGSHGVVLNFARSGIVDDTAIIRALDAGRLHAYVTDFPTASLVGNPRVIALPHLGASTGEAEENCAVMAAETLKSYLEDGNIKNSVNFPEATLRRTRPNRLAIANANVPNMVGQVSTALAESRINIADLLNRSRGEVAYTLLDLDGPLPAEVLDRIRGIDGILKARLLTQ